MQAEVNNSLIPQRQFRAYEKYVFSRYFCITITKYIYLDTFFFHSLHRDIAYPRREMLAQAAERAMSEGMKRNGR